MEKLDTDALIRFLTETGTEFGMNLVAALAIFVIGRFVARLLSNGVKRLMAKSNVDEMLVRFVGNLVFFALLTFVALAAISQLGIQTASFIAVLGAAGLAIGLALQGSLANFAAGVLVIIFRPYRIGDFVEGGGVSGSVESVQIFTTVLKSPDNKKIIVPNGQMMNGTITNYSANDTRRVDMTAGVGYDDDLDKVKKVLEQILEEDDRILAEPAPVVKLMELADSSVNFVVRPWVKTADYWGVYFETMEKIKRRFDAEDISIPFPQRDVHLYSHNAQDSA